MAKPNSTSPLDPTVHDGISLHDAADVLAERLDRRITINYPSLRQVLEICREKAGWRPSTSHEILLSADPGSEGQQRFQAMLKHAGFEVSVTHYRDAFISLPPGRTPQEAVGRPAASFGAKLAYIAGLMARHPNPHFLVVTHSFDLHEPLVDLARRFPHGRVGLAYFGSLLDYRWRATGLLEGKIGVGFFDLDEHGEAIVGADLISRPKQSPDVRTGFARF
jgi:hypothetical protein